MIDLNQKSNKATPNKDFSKKLKEQVADAGDEVKQRAGEALQASRDVARDKFKEAADAANHVAADAMDQFQGQAREQQRSGADFVERFAGNIREAAKAFESDAPIAARGVNSAAEYVEEAAQKIRHGNFRDLVDSATDFAKRQPAAFLGISVLAGFAAVRFLKASGGSSSSSPRPETTNQATSASSGQGWEQGSSTLDNSDQTSSQSGVVS